MKIIKLQAENVKKIKAVEIEPDENTVIISGKNGQGKTSILDSIWWALGGNKNIPEKPIRDGETRAEVTLDLGDMIVTRKWTSNDKSYLQVMNKDGVAFASPQKMLDKLIGDLSFDPLEFARAEKDKQIKILLKAINIPPFHKKLQEISGIEINTSEPVNEAFNKAYKYVYDERTLINRELKTLKTKYESIEIPSKYKNKDIKQISIKELYEEKQKYEEIYKDYTDSVNRINNIREEIKRLEEELSTLETKVEKVNISDVELKIEEITEELNEADEINQVAERITLKTEAKKELDAKTRIAAELNKKLETIKKFKEEIINQADMPLKGLDFANGSVVYNGIPFEQLSASEQLKISLAIAMSLNPDIRVIRITDGSLLDSNSLDIIKKLADKKDYQVWIEMVDDTGKLGIYIEDGEVKDIEGEK